MLGLSCEQISFDYMKLCGKYGPKRAKMAKKCIRLATRHGFYLRPRWTVLAEILGDNSPIVGLPCAWISLGCIKAHRSSGQKRPKIRLKNQFFEKVPYRYDGEIFLYRTQMVPRGSRLTSKKFSSVRFFWYMARSDIHFDMQCACGSADATLSERTARAKQAVYL